MITMRLFAMAACLSLIACGEERAQGNRDQLELAPLNVGIVDRSGEQIGTVEMSEDANGMTLRVSVAGLTEGMKAVHLHEAGSCAGPDFTSAGGHWNPSGREHGRDNPAGAHVGDLANLGVGSNGEGSSTYLLSGILRDGTQPQLADSDGTAFVIHEGPDDYMTDPSGDSGARIGCAVLAAAR